MDVTYFLKNMSYDEKKQLAWNPNTSKNVLLDLSKEKDFGIRCAVARNPNTPMDILQYLAEDKDYGVRNDIDAL